MTNRRRVSMLCAILIALGNGMFLHTVSQASSSAIQTNHFIRNPVELNEFSLAQEPESFAQKGRFQPAAIFIVTNEAQLAAAITTANSNGQPDIINITVDIGLTSLLPDILSDGGNSLTINGSGSHRTISRTSGTFRIFNINQASTVLMMNDLTISNGIDNFGNGGGGIRSIGTLSLTNCTVSNNSAMSTGDGGGIWSSGNLTLTNCTVSNNTASIFGGGIHHQNAGALTLTNCLFSGNTIASSGGGGGLHTHGSTGMITGCTFTGNQAQGSGPGGAIVVDSFTNLTMTNSTVSGNTAAGGNGGGGIYVTTDSGSATLVNCTIAGNNASNTGSNRGGGGVRIQPEH